MTHFDQSNPGCRNRSSHAELLGRIGSSDVGNARWEVGEYGDGKSMEVEYLRRVEGLLYVMLVRTNDTGEFVYENKLNNSIYCVEGEARFEIVGGPVFEMRPGSALTLPPGVVSRSRFTKVPYVEFAVLSAEVLAGAP